MTQRSEPGGSAPRRLLERFPALQHRNFRLLWIGQIISVSGSQMQAVAINWQIYEKTGSPVMLGMVGLARVLPIVLFSLVGGVFADSFSRRRIMLLTQSVMMLVATTLGLLSYFDATSALVILA